MQYTDNMTCAFLPVEQTVTMATPPENPSYDRTQAIVIASILGTCAFSVISVLLVCGLLYCVCKKDFGVCCARCVHVYVVCRCVLYVCICACMLCVYAVLCVQCMLSLCLLCVCWGNSVLQQCIGM